MEDVPVTIIIETMDHTSYKQKKLFIKSLGLKKYYNKG